MGCQWPAIAKGLQHLPIFYDSLQKSSEVMKELGLDLMAIMTDESNTIDDIFNALIAITATQIALIDLFRELDIVPDGYVGHSLGEVACGYCDGGVDRKQTLINTYWRARLVQQRELTKGVMAAVGLSWEECQKRCPEGVFLACHNSEDSVTISGEFEATNRFIEQLKGENISAKEVKSCGIAFHSPLIAPILKTLLENIKKLIIEPKERSAKWISSSVPESDWNTDLAKYCSAEYYEHNMSSAVLFHEALQHVPRNAVVIEIAPHPLLKSIIMRSLGSDITFIPLLMKNNNFGNLQLILSSIGLLYQLGFNPNIDKLYPRVSYPVSRGTPSLSPLIKWDHSDDWFVPLYPDYFNPKNSFENKIIIDLERSEDAFYLDHQIQGHVIFPGTGYLVMIWQMLAKSVGKSINECPIEWTNIKLHRAVILNDHDKSTFTIQCGNNGQYVIKNNNQVIFSGMAVLLDQTSVNNFKPISSFLDKIEETENKIVFNSMEIYKEFRIRGYDYGTDFRLIREASADGHQANVVFNGNWITFLDSVMQINILNKKHRYLYLPVKLQSVRCDPTIFTETLNKIDKDNREAMFTVTQDSIMKTINVGHSIQIKQIDWNLTKIKHKNCTIEQYEFVPYTSTISNNKLDQLFEMCTQLTFNLKDRLKNGHVTESATDCCKENDLISNNSDGLDKKYTLIELLGDCHRSRSNLVKTLNVCFNINDIDFMVTDNIYSNEIVIRPLIDIVIENSSSLSFNIIELCSYGESCVLNSVKSVIDCCYPQLETNYKLIMPNEYIRATKR